MLRLADEIGPDRLSTTAVAGAVGVSQPAIFRHFPTKGALWLAVAEEIAQRLTAAWDAAEARAETLRKGVETAVALGMDRRLVDLRAAAATRAEEVERLEERMAEIEADQERVRRNLAAVPAIDALHGRLLRQLEALETRMEETQRNRDRARLIEDGPFPDVKDQLGGYVVSVAAYLDAAIDGAGRAPAADAGSVEVRPVMPRNALP
jgi:hypothetical protein